MALQANTCVHVRDAYNDIQFNNKQAVLGSCKLESLCNGTVNMACNLEWVFLV